MQHSPEEVYALLTDPRAETVFRSIQACTKREVVAEDKKMGRRKLLVCHK